MWLCLATIIFSPFLLSPFFFCWEGDSAYPRLAPVAHISLHHSFPFVHPSISPLVLYISYILCPPVLCMPIHNVYFYIL
ncbi:hypothetical protein B0H14DRAFT_2874464, partial [Mycena olivaceomarginata]